MVMTIKFYLLQSKSNRQLIDKISRITKTKITRIGKILSKKNTSLGY